MPLLFIAVPLCSVVILNLAYRWVNHKAALWTAVAVSVLQICLSAVDIVKCLKTGDVLVSQFFSPLSIDLLSAVVLLTIGLISFVSLMIVQPADRRETFNFVSTMFLIIIGMNGLTMVRDLFTLYVFVEITSAASFILIGIRKDRDGLEGAFKYYLMSAVATVLMLTAVALLFMGAGDSSFESVRNYIESAGGRLPYEAVIALILFTAGLAIKSGAIPFHTWVLDAYSAASSPVSVLLSGIVTKASGVYALMRIFRDVFADNAAVGNVLLLIALVSIIVGALGAMGQNDMKRMLAYSSISQIGYIILGLSTGSALGFLGALFHFFNHATFKSLLFTDSAAIEMQTGTRNMDKMGGLADKMHVTGFSSIVGFLSAAGIPPLSGFWSKLLIIMAVWRISVPAALTALLAGLLTLAYFLIMQKKVFFGKVPEELKNIKEAGPGFVSAQVVLTAVNIALGVLFPLILVYMQGLALI